MVLIQSCCKSRPYHGYNKQDLQIVWRKQNGTCVMDESENEGKFPQLLSKKKGLGASVYGCDIEFFCSN